MADPDAANALDGKLRPLVRVRGVVKSFGGVRALRGVDLEVLPGEVHALLGENGAGKSTLIKILSGVHDYDEGTIELGGAPVRFQSPAQSREAGIAVVYQDLSLVESLSVADNLLLGREPRTRFGFLRKRRILDEARALPRRSGRRARSARQRRQPAFRATADDRDLQGPDGRCAGADPRRADLGADGR